MSKTWTKVPNDIIRLTEMSASLFRVYCLLLAQKDGLSLSVCKMVKITALSKSTIYRSIQILVDVDLLEKIKEEGYANKYKAGDDISVDKLRQGLVTRGTGGSVTRIPSSNAGYPSDDTTLCHQKYTPLSPEVQGVIHSDPDHPRAYTNRIKKTREKTKREDYREKTKECSAFKNFSFLDWQKEVAGKWAEHYCRVLPNMPKPHIEKWANEVRLIANAYNLTHDGFMTLFRFVERDSFWRDKAESVMTLRKRNASGIPKIVNIMKAIPAFRSAAAEKAFVEDNLTDEQKEIREVLKNFGRKR